MATTPLQGITYPSLSDPANGPSALQTALEFLEKRLVMRFSTAAARDAAITSPEEGMVVYLTTDNYGCYYDGTSWVGLWGAVPWIAPTFTNSWTNFGSGYQNAQYRKVGDRVSLRGIIKSGASGSVAFTLPAGFRPPAPIQFAINGNGSFGYCEVQADGDVQITGSGVATAAALDGISFSVTT